MPRPLKRRAEPVAVQTSGQPSRQVASGQADGAPVHGWDADTKREWEADLASYRERNRAQRLALAPHEEGSDAWIDRI